jgi:hypothetical protein
MAALNNLEVKAADVQNVCLTVPVSERMQTRLGPEFGSGRCKVAIVARALHGLKSTGRHPETISPIACVYEMGCVSCKADNDLWFKPKARPDDRFQHHSYALCYVDDVLAMHHDAMTQIQQINKQFPLSGISR